mmetsp:Transcript_31862/g.75708  ORF Transcript_31862/g.75708 Transcript_31862/m.75708 type:complete len:226 (+) Transcript_31862:1614-2291(+)
MLGVGDELAVRALFRRDLVEALLQLLSRELIPLNGATDVLEVRLDQGGPLHQRVPRLALAPRPALRLQKWVLLPVLLLRCGERAIEVVVQRVRRELRRDPLQQPRSVPPLHARQLLCGSGCARPDPYQCTRRRRTGRHDQACQPDTLSGLGCRLLHGFGSHEAPLLSHLGRCAQRDDGRGARALEQREQTRLVCHPVCRRAGCVEGHGGVVGIFSSGTELPSGGR